MTTQVLCVAGSLLLVYQYCTTCISHSQRQTDKKHHETNRESILTGHRQHRQQKGGDICSPHGENVCVCVCVCVREREGTGV